VGAARRDLRINSRLSKGARSMQVRQVNTDTGGKVKEEDDWLCVSQAGKERWHMTDQG
jgi:hypothetical protein